MAPSITIPAHLLTVRYNAAVHPGVAHPADLSTGANCQVFAYALLAHFGIAFPPLRSSELWADAEYSRAVEAFEPLDLLLFSKTADAFGAHVAVCVGAGRASTSPELSASPSSGASRISRRTKIIAF
ncbi:hypothetical protein [Devosia riboflavina]|uniref:hypothetical protein n=1 Tax=Devosia riboflavina TaxID=46914 RepID=UPI00068CDAE7|nr:hypothetical protein [Devosia riboflavina]